MEVLTPGSENDVIVLKLPPIFEGLIPDNVTVETDPIFSAWDKSDGISISKNQISDRSDIVTTDGGSNTTNIHSIFPGTNTGDQDLTGLIPYTGATGNANLGSHSLTADRVYGSHDTPIASSELVTKAYADNLAFTGAGGISPTVAHNSTTGKEGGANGHWYHLSDTANTVITDITTAGSDIVPLGLTITASGISSGKDGLAWVELNWTAIVSNTFDHYQIEYKKSAYNFYTPLSSTSNTIIIEGLTPNTSYNFRVASVNKYGTSSAFCTDVISTTPADSVAPSTVSGVSATPAIQAVLLKWTHNTDVDLASYNIYSYGSDNSASSTKIANYTGNVYMVNGLSANTTYYFWLKAVDTSGNESTAFSTSVYATTRNVIASDIENIAANQVIIQGATTLASWSSPGVTTIDGSKITTGSVTLSQLNFTPIVGSNIIATINASPEGIQIDADNFAVSGSTIFTSKLGGSYSSANSLPRIRIFPNSDTGIEVIDDLGHNVFTALIGGTNIGDVIIGNWSGGSGIYYDKSANNGLGSTSFTGTITAGAGTIGGWTITSAALVKDTGSNATSSGMAPADYPFYSGATYANRATAPWRVTYNGTMYASTVSITSLTDGKLVRTLGGMLTDAAISQTNDKISIDSSTGIVIPRISGAPGTPEPGMIYYNTSVGHAYLYTNAWRQLD